MLENERGAGKLLAGDVFEGTRDRVWAVLTHAEC